MKGIQQYLSSCYTQSMNAVGRFTHPQASNHVEAGETFCIVMAVVYTAVFMYNNHQASSIKFIDTCSLNTLLHVAPLVPLSYHCALLMLP